MVVIGSSILWWRKIAHDKAAGDKPRRAAMIVPRVPVKVEYTTRIRPAEGCGWKGRSGAILRAMSGHSKWSQIKRDKGQNDVKRGAVFTKMGREISVAARAGGADQDGNFRLRLAVERARAINMPLDTIKRAIEKATGGGEGEQFEEITYEGYGPGGVAILIETATDNKNRTAADVRSILTKAGGQLAGSGSVAWQFEQRGVIVLSPGGDPDELTLVAIDAGAEDVDTTGDQIEVLTKPNELEAVRRAIEAAGVKIESAELSMSAQNMVELELGKARQALRLIELLEDQDDVQRVTSNFEIPEALMAEVGG